MSRLRLLIPVAIYLLVGRAFSRACRAGLARSQLNEVHLLATPLALCTSRARCMVEERPAVKLGLRALRAAHSVGPGVVRGHAGATDVPDAAAHERHQQQGGRGR